MALLWTRVGAWKACWATAWRRRGSSPRSVNEGPCCCGVIGFASATGTGAGALFSSSFRFILRVCSVIASSKGDIWGLIANWGTGSVLSFSLKNNSDKMQNRSRAGLWPKLLPRPLARLAIHARAATFFPPVST